MNFVSLETQNVWLRGERDSHFIAISPITLKALNLKKNWPIKKTKIMISKYY